MSDDEDLYKNLVTLLKIFKNKPYHLAKFLLENSSLQKDFMKKLIESAKLKGMLDSVDNSVLHFNDISQMNDFYSSFFDDITKLNIGKTKEEIEIDLNNRLDLFIEEEKYEDASRIRDYMLRNNIKRIK